MRSLPRRLATTVAAVALVGCTPAASQTPSTTPNATSPVSSTPTSSAGVAYPSATASASASATATASVAPGHTASWLDAGKLREARNATNVVLVGTHEVLVVGSDYQTSWLSACGAATNGSDSVEIGDPVAKKWGKTASLPSPREAPAVVALRDGRALMTGGERGENDGNISYSSTYVFDPSHSSWTKSGLMNSARSNPASAVLADGRVLVAGGRYIDTTHHVRFLDSSEIWDPATGKWSRTGRLAAPRLGASAVTLADGRVLIVGGIASPDSAPAEQASAEVYDADRGTWSPAGSLKRARSGFALVALADGGAIVAGGFLMSAFTRLSSVERFDPAANRWSSAAALPDQVAGAAGIRLADGRVLLAGGSEVDPDLVDANAGTYVSGLTADAVLFDPKAGRWTATAPMPSRRAGASAVLLKDGTVILVGGSSGEGNPADTPSCPEADAQVFRYFPGA
jgi:N-acetylneuraminic acid mutarotase